MLTPIKPLTVGDVLRNTLPAMNGLAANRAAVSLRHIAYTLAYDRRLMREVDADKTTLDRPASPALLALSGRLVDVWLDYALADWEATHAADMREAMGHQK